jgi:hypothetical protein
MKDYQDVEVIKKGMEVIKGDGGHKRGWRS